MLEMVWQSKALIQWYALLGLIALALWKGGGPERGIAGTFLFVLVGDRLYHWAFGAGTTWLSVDLGHFLIDAIALAMFASIALRANRVYPLWLASFQLMTVISHPVRAINPRTVEGVYAILNYAPSYLELLVFGLGIVAHLQRQARFGPYRSWQSC